MVKDEELLEYDKERFKLREKVYHSLFRKMFFLAQLVAICCVVFEECDEQGVISPDVELQIKMIDDFFDAKREYYEWDFDRFFAQSDGKDYMGRDGRFCKGHDAKELLSEQLWDLIIQIISKTTVQRDVTTKREEIDDNEFNKRIVQQYFLIRDKYKDHNHILHKLLKDCENRTNGKIGIDNIVLLAFGKNNYDIVMKSYKLLLDKLFSNNGAGKKFCNHFIDMTNVAMVETLNEYNVIVLTRDKEWQSILLDSDYKSKCINLDFYKKFKLVLDGQKPLQS